MSEAAAKHADSVENQARVAAHKVYGETMAKLAAEEETFKKELERKIALAYSDRELAVKKARAAAYAAYMDYIKEHPEES